MRLSITSTLLGPGTSVPPGENLSHCLKLCREAGFRYADLDFGALVRPGFPLSGEDWEEQTERIGRQGEELGLSFDQSHAFVYRTREWTDPAVDRGLYGDRIRRSILAAARLKVRWLVFHTADLDAPPDDGFEKTRAFNLEYWQPFVGLAVRHGVGIAFENLFMSGRHPRYGMTAEDLADLVDTIGDPLVGVCWDTGHAHVAGQDQPASIRLLGPRLKALHVHDNHGRPKADEHLSPYRGTIVWPPILKALRETGYSGNFSLELKRATAELPDALCGDMLRFLHRLGRYMIEQAEAG